MKWKASPAHSAYRYPAPIDPKPMNRPMLMAANRPCAAGGHALGRGALDEMHGAKVGSAEGQAVQHLQQGEKYEPVGISGQEPAQDTAGTAEQHQLDGPDAGDGLAGRTRTG